MEVSFLVLVSMGFQGFRPSSPSLQGGVADLTADPYKATSSHEARVRGTVAFRGHSESPESLEFAIPSIPILLGFPVRKGLTAAFRRSFADSARSCMQSGKSCAMMCMYTPVKTSFSAQVTARCRGAHRQFQGSRERPLKGVDGNDERDKVAPGYRVGSIVNTGTDDAFGTLEFRSRC